MKQRVRENAFSAAFTTALRSQNAMVYPVVAGMHTPSGWPDKIVWHRYWHGLIELKSDLTAVEPEQYRVISELNHRVPWHAMLIRRDGDDHKFTVTYLAKDQPTEVFVSDCSKLLKELAHRRDQYTRANSE